MLSACSLSRAADASMRLAARRAIVRRIVEYSNSLFELEHVYIVVLYSTFHSLKFQLADK